MLVAISTFPNEGRKLKNFIQALVKSGLVACVSRINYVKSYYIREGKFQQEEEKILLIKLPKENKDKFTGFFKKNHPYEVPELIFLNPEDVDKAYLDRVLASKNNKIEKRSK